MTATETTRRPSPAARRVGYGFGMLVGLVGLFLINIWPGWESLSFLTADTTKVLWLVNASLIAGVVADLVYARYDPPWLVALGGVVTTAIALAALIRIMQVFPVDSAAGTSTARCWSGCC